jgi:dTDP-4-amino-4,6-dideoxygalactose transaminase
MIPFNRPHLTGKELTYITEAHAAGQLSGNGTFTQRCQDRLAQQLGSARVLLTHSCTAALEMAALLADLRPGDEVIMPSFTFVSTANAFVLRGAVPVFVDIRPDTLNLDEAKVARAITPRTRAIVPVHYAGVGCEMDTILSLAKENSLLVIEDAAHGMWATYKQRELGSLGQLGALSFHETKNIICGEGGALLLNDPSYIERAEIIWQKGTDRNRFSQGLVDKYSWVDIGSSFLPSDLSAAFLWAQLEKGEEITAKRKAGWLKYQEQLSTVGKKSWFSLPVIPKECAHNAHLFYLLARDQGCRDSFLQHARSQEVSALFHYVPLHLASFGKAHARCPEPLRVTERIAGCLIRLPLFADLQPEEIKQVLHAVESFVP